MLILALLLGLGYRAEAAPETAPAPALASAVAQKAPAADPTPATPEKAAAPEPTPTPTQAPALGSVPATKETNAAPTATAEAPARPIGEAVWAAREKTSPVHPALAVPEKAPAAGSPLPGYTVSAEHTRFLDELQADTFRYFWETTPADTGLTPDRFPGESPSSIAAVGFALTSYPVGVRHGWITREQAAERTLATLRFLWQAPQGPAAQGVSGYHGFYYHFLDAHTGQRYPGSELSTVDTALLMAGVLAAHSFFDAAEAPEAEIRKLADRLYRRVDWTWAYSRRRRPLLSMGWTPEQGPLHVDWAGYNEAMIVYLLALGSPTHPIDPRAWAAWTASYHWDDHYGFGHVSFGPLFGHQYSHVWVDFRGIQDAYMKERGIDYFVNSTRATYANHAYCVANPANWNGYDGLLWGLTASDGPTPLSEPSGGRTFHNYWARGTDPDDLRDDGTIAPTAAGGSVPFAPELAIPTLWSFRQRFGDRLYGKYGFKDAFNLSYPQSETSAAGGWFDDQYLGIDEGPILLMIENYRTGFVWELMAKSAALRSGLAHAGFSGGWLAAH